MDRFHLVLATVVPLLVISACSDQSARQTDQLTSADESANTSLADEVVRSELVIEGLRVPLAALSKGVLNLRLPDERGRSVLAETLDVVDLATTPKEAREPLLDLGFERGNWPVAGEKLTVSSKDLSLWNDFLATVDFFHHFKFYNVRGEFHGPERYHTDSGFKGAAQLKDPDCADNYPGNSDHAHS